jgi:hypothetical protein
MFSRYRVTSPLFVGCYQTSILGTQSRYFVRRCEKV